MLYLICNDQDSEERFIGQLDIKLTESCKNSAIELGKTIADIKIEAVFSSNLSRAIDISNIILQELKRKPNYVFLHQNELNERSYGIIEGLTLGQAKVKFSPKKYKQWERDFFEAPPFGESLSQLEERIVSYYKKRIFPFITANQNIIIITHKNVIKVLIGYIRNLKEEEIIEMNIENNVLYEINI